MKCGPVFGESGIPPCLGSFLCRSSRPTYPRSGHHELFRSPTAPFDLLTGDDFFSPEGRAKLNDLLDDPWLYADHSAPECRLFSKARGEPITLQDGRVITGPRPVRDFPNLSGEMKVRLRRSNAMALKALKRGEKVAEDRVSRHWTLEHPYGRRLWEFKLVKKLETPILNMPLEAAAVLEVHVRSRIPSLAQFRRCARSSRWTAQAMMDFCPTRWRKALTGPCTTRQKKKPSTHGASASPMLEG